MSVQPLETEIEIEIVFECTICFITDVKFPTKYNCSNCTKKICNDCFARHILTKNNCVFCRSPLILDKKDIITLPPHPVYIFLCVRYGKITCSMVCIMTTWYIFLFVFMLQGFSDDGIMDYGKVYNNSDTGESYTN